MTFEPYFSQLTRIDRPHPWQSAVGNDSRCAHRLLRVPTGFGKTAGVVIPWLYHRVERADLGWPTRLAICLPMRVLVEQTERAVRDWLNEGNLTDRVSVGILMGGVNDGGWLLTPGKPAILVGTQDMLLSRALNRGYGSGRARWPMELGLLGTDTLWIFDEIQLMDVGLATATQLAAFRKDEEMRHSAPRPSASWFMSATLQPSWLGTVDFRPTASLLAGETICIPASQRKGGLWNVRKAVERADSIFEPGEVAALAIEKHQAGRLTLIVTNTVRRARETFAALKAALSTSTGRGKSKVTSPRPDAPEIRLVHSQFRGAERQGWAKEILFRGAPVPDAGRILVATQVIEAGVDMSAATLMTDLAPWPSLVQRFGRVARYQGEEGRIVVLGAPPTAEEKARPYSIDTLASAAKAIDILIERHRDGSPRSLEALEEELRGDDPKLLDSMFPFRPEHVLRRPDFDELFDTSTDLSGADIDVSRFIRSGEERDVMLFWRAIEKVRDRWPAELSKRTVPPARREELCPVPIQEAREWTSGHQAWIFDYLEGKWVALSRRRLGRLVPGATLLVPCDAGGYSAKEGFFPKAIDRVDAILPAPISSPELALFEATEGEDDESLSEAQWKTIAVHGMEVGQRVREVADGLGVPPDFIRLLELAGRWHDAGKAHPVFQNAIENTERQRATMAGVAIATGRALAKAPKTAWRRPAYPERPGFRHELASTLALLELVRRTAPSHPALTASHADVLASAGIGPVDPPLAAPVDPAHPLGAELAKLTAEELDLVAWLVCSHHGKVRCQWLATPHDLERAGRGGESSINGVIDGEALPAFDLMTAAAHPETVPELSMSLSCANLGLNARYGRSWTERVSGLIRRHGPFTLAWLEALLRAADIQASRLGEEAPS